MKCNHLFALVVASLPFAVFTPASVSADPKDDEKAELARLAGTWKMTSYQKAGEERIKDQEDAPEIIITFKKDGSFDWANEVGSPGKIMRIDPSKKVKEIDYLFTAGENEGKVEKGIYKLERDTFTDCFNVPGGQERPSEFKSTKENGYSLAVYKRVKKID